MAAVMGDWHAREKAERMAVAAGALAATASLTWSCRFFRKGMNLGSPLGTMLFT